MVMPMVHEQQIAGHVLGEGNPMAVRDTANDQVLFALLAGILHHRDKILVGCQNAIHAEEAVTKEEGSRISAGLTYGHAIVEHENCPHVLMDGKAKTGLQAINIALRTTRKQRLMVSGGVFSQPGLETAPQVSELRYVRSHGSFYITWNI